MRHYTYLLVDPETMEFYHGSRSCICDPEEDKEYMSSGLWPKEAMRSGRNLRKIIIREYETRQEADDAERALYVLHRTNRLNRNNMFLKKWYRFGFYEQTQTS